MSLMTSPLLVERAKIKSHGRDKQAKSTGANTPNPTGDSVFCFTSESSECEMNSTPPLDLHATLELRDYQQLNVASLPAFTMPAFPIRHHEPRTAAKAGSISPETPNPVAAMVASSVSSRSREDIIIWAKTVDQRAGEGGMSESDEDFERGRSLTRRPTRVSETDADASGALGSTPKGRIGSALAGLSMSSFGVGPFVKALTSGKTQPVKVSHPPASSLGLHSVPVPAEVSRIAVTNTTQLDSDSYAHSHVGGATPTLSTISFSEVVDPSLMIEAAEDVEVMTDDQSAVSFPSGLRRLSSGIVPKMASKSASLVLLRANASASEPVPRPISSTTSAIWNLSSYLRSFVPFSISSVLAPSIPPFVKQSPQAAITVSPFVASAALPAVRSESPSLSVPHLVRSLLMDIVVPPPAQSQNDKEPRSRSREKPSRGPSRPPPSRRDPSRRRHPRTHARQWSYDADMSDTSDREERGRSRRGKALGAAPALGPGLGIEVVERHTSRERDWSPTRRSSSRSRGRRAERERARE